MDKTYKWWIPVIGKVRVETKRVWSVALVTGVKLCLHLKQFPAVTKLANINLQQYFSTTVTNRITSPAPQREILQNIKFYAWWSSPVVCFTQKRDPLGQFQQLPITCWCIYYQMYSRFLQCCDPFKECFVICEKLYRIDITPSYHIVDIVTMAYVRSKYQYKLN